MTAKIVTAYVALNGNPDRRSDATYRELGKRLTDMDVPIRAFVDFPLEDCWLWPHLQTLANAPRSTDLAAYHAVQYSKVQWMRLAAQEDPAPDVFVWVDYGIFHHDGMQEGCIELLLEAADDQTIAMPGKVPKNSYFMRQRNVPHWRFCGSVMVCPRRYLQPLDEAIREVALEGLAKHGSISWEVNTWAEVELQEQLPIRQYQAGDGPAMFLNYGE